MLDFDGGKSGGAEEILAAKAPHSKPAVTFSGFLVGDCRFTAFYGQ
jgi:hypothetical protein